MLNKLNKTIRKIFEQTMGQSFEKKTGYAYTGEGRGSIQIANMIIDGQRKPDVIS
jgi:molybdate/tungstate transport system substrate-binding protein